MNPVSAARSGPPPTRSIVSTSVSTAAHPEQRVPDRGRLPDPRAVVDPRASRCGVDRLHPGQCGGQHGDGGAHPDAAHGTDQQVGAGVDLGVGEPPAGADRSLQFRLVHGILGSIRWAGRTSIRPIRDGRAALGHPDVDDRTPTPAAAASAAASPFPVARSVARRTVSPAHRRRYPQLGDVVIGGEHHQLRPPRRQRPRRGTAGRGQQVDDRGPHAERPHRQVLADLGGGSGRTRRPGPARPAGPTAWALQGESSVAAAVAPGSSAGVDRARTGGSGPFVRTGG